MTDDMKQSIIEEASILMTGHPSKDARWFAKSVYEYLMAEQPAEPVAHENSNGVVHAAGYPWSDKEVLRPLVYGDTAPQPVKREPLTDEQIDVIWELSKLPIPQLEQRRMIVNAIIAAYERKNGIGGQV